MAPSILTEVLRNFLQFSSQIKGEYLVYEGSRDSVVGIVTTYGLDDREVGVRVPDKVKNPRLPARLWGPHNLLYNGYGGALSPGVKRPGREADHSPPASAEVKKTSTPPYAFMAWCLIN
jgi:hypothetical protein